MMSVLAERGGKDGEGAESKGYPPLESSELWVSL